jgi:ATP-dependent DNA ligase
MVGGDADGMLFSEAIEAEGAPVSAEVCKMGLEGIVSKRVGSLYRSGPSRNWLKTKNPNFVTQIPRDAIDYP